MRYQQRLSLRHRPARAHVPRCRSRALEMLAVVAAFFAAGLWTAIAVLFAAPALLATPALAAVVISAPSASALWLVVASVEAARAGMPRWSLVFVSAFVAVLIIGSAFIQLSGFDVRKVLVPLGWAVWMIDVGRALRARLSPVVNAPRPSSRRTRCENCGAPRPRTASRSAAVCGLPYGVRPHEEPAGPCIRAQYMANPRVSYRKHHTGISSVTMVASAALLNGGSVRPHGERIFCSSSASQTPRPS